MSHNLCKDCLTRECTREGICPQGRIITSKCCHKLNVFTANCNCASRATRPHQCIRLVGDPESPLWYVDLKIFNRSFPALVNTSIRKCRINYHMSMWLQAKSNGVIDEEVTEIIIPFRRYGRTIDVECEVFKPNTEVIEIGMLFLKTFGYKFTFERVTINSDNSPILSSPYEVEYAYNLSPRGRDLRNYLIEKKRFLKRGRIIKLEDWPPTPTSTRRVVVVRRSSDRESSPRSNQLVHTF